MLRDAPEQTRPEPQQIPFDRVLRLLAEHGISVDPASARALPGGRTNQVWQVDAAQGRLVCKLYRAAQGSELFPNDAACECAALKALAGREIAPTLVDCIGTETGDLIVYRHVEAQAANPDPQACGALLARLHSTPAPNSLRSLPSGSAALVAQAERILSQISPAARATLQERKPDAAHEADAVLPVFLHGDPVPANFIASPSGHRLIDWQCPAIGDACEDLAIFLAPAMQILYGAGLLSTASEAAFLTSYGDPTVTDRLKRLAPYFHWRMAAHCQWKVERGEADYAAGRDAELAALASAVRRSARR